MKRYITIAVLPFCMAFSAFTVLGMNQAYKNSPVRPFNYKDASLAQQQEKRKAWNAANKAFNLRAEEPIETLTKELPVKLHASDAKQLSEHLFKESLSFVETPSGLSTIPVDNFSNPDTLRIKKNVDQLQLFRAAFLLSLPAQDAKIIVNDQLKALSGHLTQEINDSRNALGRAFGLDTDSAEWCKAIQNVEYNVNLRLQMMKQQRFDTVCHPELHPLWVKNVKNALSFNGLHPTSINMGICSGPEDGFAHAAAFRVNRDGNMKSLFRPTTINITKAPGGYSFQYWEKKPLFPLQLQQAASHEVTHLNNGHGELIIGAEQAILDFYRGRSNPEELNSKIKNSSAYFKFLLSTEREADVYHATKFPEAAQAARSVATSDCPFSMYMGSYPMIAIADTNFRVSQEIDKREKVA